MTEGEAERQTTTSILFSSYSHRLIRSCEGYILMRFIKIYTAVKEAQSPGLSSALSNNPVF